MDGYSPVVGKDLRLLLSKEPVDEPGRCLICGLTTRNKKMYCREHVEEHGYAQAVRERFDLMQAEARLVSKRKRSAKPQDLVALEILACLTTGPESARWISSELGLPREVLWARVEVVEAYVSCLLRSGQLVLVVVEGVVRVGLAGHIQIKAKDEAAA